jgi:hypothetical protein
MGCTLDLGGSSPADEGLEQTTILIVELLTVRGRYRSPAIAEAVSRRHQVDLERFFP